MVRKLRRYMVGFDDDHQTVYGKAEETGVKYADPFTLKQAERYVKSMLCKGVVIYKLVKVRTKRGSQ